MGNYWVSAHITHPDTTPRHESAPTFDPMLGFPKGRKPREMKMSEEDMMAAKIPLKQRDFCAHKWMELHECKRIHYPLMLKCAHKKHEYEQCQVEDYTIRLKEYERERRLRERQKRKQQAAAA
ncbi:hypothetical protein DMN91_008333 [Ooceraea biroi]|uniref:NADH dehydrogenase [ubiquinone] 1 beta subcomplex subunit 7 n=1 Tax=Ooceraea biroi TaxID=2015173 RepID=A0A026VWN8_OOCBI|nr:NADH dehydrogenase [ubiquinone] 1 beta subcomplex subunit 7 [Ooceraea biroi]EZA48147.1 NADH dehydrogenase [ubiquinone] 1 beta subcomplex subunit [Ooceraea biroi]RLU19775.1 hypothetical protein DMN91_008333 [Ooceraea biroi]